MAKHAKKLVLELIDKLPPAEGEWQQIAAWVDENRESLVGEIELCQSVKDGALQLLELSGKDANLFFDVLGSLTSLLHKAPNIGLFVADMWVIAYNSSPPDFQVSIRSSFVSKRDDDHFWLLLEPLRHALPQLEMTVDEVIAFFGAVVERTVGDLGAGEATNALKDLCAKKPELAGNIIDSLLTNYDGDLQLKLIPTMLEGLAVATARESAIKDILDKAWNAVNDCRTRECQLCVGYSFGELFKHGYLSIGEFQELFRNFSKSTDERVQDSAFYSMFRLFVGEKPIEQPDECIVEIETILGSQTQILDNAKYHLVVILNQLYRLGLQEKLQIDLWFSRILPVKPKHKGTLERLVNLLKDMCKTSSERFPSIFERVVLSQPEFYTDLHYNSPFVWLLTEVDKAGMLARITSSWLGSEKETLRLAALEFYTQKPSLDPNILHNWTQDEKRRALKTIVRKPRLEKTEIRLLSELAPAYEEERGTGLRDAFLWECKHQGANYHGLLNEYWLEDSSKVLREAKQAAEEIATRWQANRANTRLDIGRKLRIDVENSFRRRMSAEIKSGAEELSIFAKLTTKVTLTYGDKAVIYPPLPRDGEPTREIIPKPMGVEMHALLFHYVDPVGAMMHRMQLGQRIIDKEDKTDESIT